LADHLLSLVRKELPVLVTKRILKDTLRGLAALHEQNIVHTRKPRNYATMAIPRAWVILMAINAL
jgi:hypothetical protein